MGLHSQYRGNDCRYYIYYLWQDISLVGRALCLFYLFFESETTI